MRKAKEVAGEQRDALLKTAIGATLLAVDEYRRLQELGQFDAMTSSWVQTP